MKVTFSVCRDICRSVNRGEERLSLLSNVRYY